jgi:hypothetical protein
MRRITTICLTLVAAALLVLPAAASAQTKRTTAAKPQITRVQPMRISVGGTLRITGRRFKAARAKNTVIFRSSDGRTAFAKPRRASRTRLHVTVPASVSRLLAVAAGGQQPTRLKLRVLAGKFSKFTPRRLSPVVTGAGEGDGPGGSAGVCNDDSDHDNDLLGNTLEESIGTDPCIEDTDKDQMSDGWEYWSARDLNIKAVPYPASRPFPNALDPSDGAAPGSTASGFDYDGDGLTTLEEYRAWRITGSSFLGSQLDLPGTTPPDLESVLGYSDGTKYSRARELPDPPAWKSASIGDYGLPNPTVDFPETYNLHGDAPWRDDERDADADGLANWLESARGPSNNAWQEGFWKQEAIKVEVWEKKAYCDQRPGFFSERTFANLDLADDDVDGDGLLDGEDDQDNDDYINVIELYETEFDLDGNGAGGENPAWCGVAADLVPSIDRDGDGVDWAVNAMNPCAPDPDSRSCPDRIPFE